MQDVSDLSHLFMDETKLVMLYGRFVFACTLRPKQEFHIPYIKSIVRFENPYFYSEFIFLPNCIVILRPTL